VMRLATPASVYPYTTLFRSDISGVNTDDQALTHSGNTLALENGGTVDLSMYLDNTDEQILTLTGTDLAISGGNSIDISSIDTNRSEEHTSELQSRENIGRRL